MRRPRRRQPIVIALYANAALLLAILVALLSRHDSPNFLSAAFAQRQSPIAGGAGVFVMPAQMSVNTWGCYLLDVDSETLCAYQYSPGDSLLKLKAARYFKFDRELKDFNTTPTWKEISDVVEKGKQSDRVIGTTNPVGPVEEKKQKD